MDTTTTTTASVTIPRLDPIDAGRITASEAPRAVITATDVSCYYGSFRAVNEVTMDIGLHEITALIGPSGCGKSTVLRALNRMNDLIPGTRVTGTIAYHGMDIYAKDVDPIEVRRRIGMVFQKPNPFPKSIYDNVAYGPKVTGMKVSNMDDLVEESLRGSRQSSATARRHGISRSLLTRWRSDYRAGMLGGRAGAQFVPVTFKPEVTVRAAPKADAGCQERIEIILVNGRRVIVPAL